MANLTVIQSNRPDDDELEVQGLNADGTPWRAVCPNGETIEVDSLQEDTVIGLTEEESQQLTEETKGE